MTALILMTHLAGGVGIGALYFGSLWWNTQRFAHGDKIATLLAVTALRFAVLGVVLWATSLEGAMPLLATASGVLLARVAVTREVGTLP